MSWSVAGLWCVLAPRRSSVTPYRDSQVAGVQVREPSAGSTGLATKRALILIVDDDEFLRDATVALLQVAGYAVIGTRTAMQALALLRSGTVKPALILLDFMMPGMNGADFRAAQLQDVSLATIPVVFVSALTRTLDALQCGPLRAAAALEKPVDAHDLLTLVGRLCPPRLRSSTS